MFDFNTLQNAIAVTNKNIVDPLAVVVPWYGVSHAIL